LTAISLIKITISFVCLTVDYTFLRGCAKNPYGLHWESLDVDLGVPELIAGVFGTKAWMTELGRLGGQVKSVAKEKAARENGKRGGRPRKSETLQEKTTRSVNLAAKANQV
jgi:hypothetical protein